MNNVLQRSTISLLLAVVSLLLVPLAASAEYSHGENGSNWMSYIDSSTPLSQITIPGTHESASASGTLSAQAQCQNENIDQQLADGTRWFDFRCHYEGHAYPNSLSMHHGILFENSYLDNCLASIYSFLSAHPSETVIVCIKEEDSSESGTQFADMVSTYIQQNINAWYWGSTIPTLGSVRGKIVLMRRFGAQGNNDAIGLNAWGWLDNNAYFNAGTGNPNIYVQDEYNPPGSNTVAQDANKWNDFINQTDKAYYDNNMNNMYINFLSIAWQTNQQLNLAQNAAKMDKMLESDASGVFSPHRYGIMAVDWSNSTIASEIYRLNNGPFAYTNNIIFTNKNSGLVLNGSLNTANGTPVTQWAWAGASQEEWTLNPLGGALYAIGNDYSNNYLDIAGGSTSNGSTVDTYTYVGSINQKFYVQPDSDNSGCWDIVSLLDGKVVEVGGNATNSGAAVDQWDWVGHPSQAWGVGIP